MVNPCTAWATVLSIFGALNENGYRGKDLG
jgi:hypothetical protein